MELNQTKPNRAAVRKALAAQIRAHIGLRRNFCVLGPEYAGCINSGSRAKILGLSGETYTVMIEGQWWNEAYKLPANPTIEQRQKKIHKDLRQFPKTPKGRKEAINYFINLSMRVGMFNAQITIERAQAQKMIQSADVSTRLEGHLRLAEVA